MNAEQVALSKAYLALKGLGCKEDVDALKVSIDSGVMKQARISLAEANLIQMMKNTKTSKVAMTIQVNAAIAGMGDLSLSDLHPSVATQAQQHI